MADYKQDQEQFIVLDESLTQQLNNGTIFLTEQNGQMVLQQQDGQTFAVEYETTPSTQGFVKNGWIFFIIRSVVS